jgi:lysophospholipase L1-like esterase
MVRSCLRFVVVFACLGAGCNSTENPAPAGSGGSLPSGGAQSAGGTSSGGTSSGGAVAGGVPGSGGSTTGGRPTGGTASGGKATGGTASGGSATGGRPAGGSSSGGKASGGTAGSGTGGASGYRPCPASDVCKIMPFGDSITDGYGVPGGYRIELFRLAHQAGKNVTFVGSQSNGPAQVDGVTFPPRHEGHSGWTIDSVGGRTGISTLVSSVMPTYTPHVITLMIGTNDANDNYDMANAPKRLGNLIDSIYAQLPSVLLVVAQIVPTQDDTINARIQAYNAGIPAVVQARADAGKHIRLVDMYPVIANNASYKTALLADTWHPNAAGYALIGAAWYGVLSDVL